MTTYYIYHSTLFLTLGLNFYLYRKKAIRHNKNPLTWGLIGLPIYYFCEELFVLLADLLYRTIRLGYFFYLEQFSIEGTVEEAELFGSILLYFCLALSFLSALWLSLRIGEFLIRPSKNQPNADNQQP
ncbi:hypothetical protein PPO43_04340 [Saprospira sp. CCB-QB6]|uniref:hypothetical protein n=1 Tax=Saprospira sp. CCB-QB6 TaxID=3023936 RepID=UPI0023498062|nr:hypothetical protein [Saprospira sp. CCB-QB6]WCL82329.1 hypothetical protein PPO43_04340 [Saprospira sp. CCB-QB6]